MPPSVNLSSLSLSLGALESIEKPSHFAASIATFIELRCTDNHLMLAESAGLIELRYAPMDVSVLVPEEKESKNQSIYPVDHVLNDISGDMQPIH